MLPTSSPRHFRSQRSVTSAESWWVILHGATDHPSAVPGKTVNCDHSLYVVTWALVMATYAEWALHMAWITPRTNRWSSGRVNGTATLLCRRALARRLLTKVFQWYQQHDLEQRSTTVYHFCLWACNTALICTSPAPIFALSSTFAKLSLVCELLQQPWAAPTRWFSQKGHLVNSHHRRQHIRHWPISRTTVLLFVLLISVQVFVSLRTIAHDPTGECRLRTMTTSYVTITSLQHQRLSAIFGYHPNIRTPQWWCPSDSRVKGNRWSAPALELKCSWESLSAVSVILLLLHQT